MKVTKKKILFIILPTALLLVGLFINATDTKALFLDDDITLFLEVNGVDLDDAVVSGTPIPLNSTTYNLNFFGIIFFHKALTVNYLEFVIVEVGIPIHTPFRIAELTNQRFPANFSYIAEAEAQIPEEFVAIINQIRGAHQLNIIFSYTLDETGVEKIVTMETVVSIQSDNPFEVLATGSGAATVVVTIVTITSIGGSIGGVATAAPAISGKWLAELKQIWKGIKTTKEVSKMSISGIPLSAKIFSGDQLKEFLDLFG